MRTSGVVEDAPVSATLRASGRAVAAAGVLLFSFLAASHAATPCTLDRATGTTIDKHPFIRNGYLTRWNLATDRISYMGPGAQGFYRIFIVGPDGAAPQDISGNTPGLPRKHHGMQYWHPSGRYLVMAAEKPDWKDTRMFGNPDFGALPGFGTHDDLWLITADGSRAWQLTNEANTKTEGELMAVFSADGTHLAWSSRQPDKTYLIKVAEFAESPEPHLEHIRTYAPGGRHYFEPGSFTSDGRSLAYSSDQDTHSFWQSQIYILDLASGASRRLTQGRAYNEHPIVVPTPGGDWIVYMSDRDEERRFLHLPGTDWWAVRPDGTGTKRLSYMNIHDRGNPQAFERPITAITVAVSPGGDTMLGDVQDSLVHQTGYSMIVRFTCD
jgi:Tol biopolymer transport system component